MRFRFADLEFQLDIETVRINVDELTVPFTSLRNETPDFHYFEQPLADEDDGEMVKYDGGFELIKTKRGLFQLNHWATCRRGYGYFLDDLSGHTPIYTNERMREQIPIASSYFLSAVGLHHKLLTKGAVVLHAAYVEHEGEAILFLGASGTGKSTQAELWEKHTDARIINGDRALLRRKDGRWTVYGYPCCGSSRICLNRTLPLRALILLRQGSDVQIERLSSASSICALAAATELYPWDPWELECAFQAAQSLTEAVPIVRFTCTKEPRTVDILRAYLEKLT